VAGNRAGRLFATATVALAVTALCASGASAAVHEVNSIQRPDLRIFMTVGAPQTSIDAIEQQIRHTPGVTSFAYVSPSDAYDSVQRNKYLREEMHGIGPTDLPGSFVVVLRGHAHRRGVAKTFRGLPDVDLVRGGLSCSYVRHHRSEVSRRLWKDALRTCVKTKGATHFE
jgi:cell division protein FtsX